MYDYFSGSHKTYTIMKQTLIALIGLFMLASCEQKNDGAVTNNNAVTTMNDKAGEPSYYGFTESRNWADTLIQRYHDTLVARANACKDPKAPKITFDDLAPKTSFMIDANMLRDYLNDSAHITKLDVYIAQHSTTDELRIVLVGAVDSIGNDGFTYNVEKPIHKEGDNHNYVLDHTVPCPTCQERIAILGGEQ